MHVPPMGVSGSPSHKRDAREAAKKNGQNTSVPKGLGDSAAFPAPPSRFVPISRIPEYVPPFVDAFSEKFMTEFGAEARKSSLG